MQDVSENVVRTTITLPPELLEQGRERAKETRRSFPKYLQVLIEQDLERGAEMPESAAANGGVE